MISVNCVAAEVSPMRAFTSSGRSRIPRQASLVQVVDNLPATMRGAVTSLSARGPRAAKRPPRIAAPTIPSTLLQHE
ncbi:hypothetical protein Areg01_17470 [Actinoplanes regularis]|nr:hypothetical protein Areg01_17470 [Actinoplanes regularis]